MFSPARSILYSMDASLCLLHSLVTLRNSVKTLSAHLLEKPAAREWFVSGVGRIACTYVPEWVDDSDAAARLDQLAGKLFGSNTEPLSELAPTEMAHELLAEVLAPEEIEDVGQTQPAALRG